MNVKLASDKLCADELHKVQSENAKQNFESSNAKALTINNSDLNEIFESYNCHFVQEIDTRERIKKVLGSIEIKAELDKIKMTSKTITIDKAISKPRNVFIHISESSINKIQFENKCNKNKPKRKINEWFDEDCREAKSTVKKKSELFRTAFKRNMTNTIQGG